MARYAQRLKDQAVARLLPPESAHIETVAQELGVGMATLERWRAEALGAPRTERTWTAAARWEAVSATAASWHTGNCLDTHRGPFLNACHDRGSCDISPVLLRSLPNESRLTCRLITALLWNALAIGSVLT